MTLEIPKAITPDDTPLFPLDVPTVEADISMEELVRIILDQRGWGGRPLTLRQNCEVY